MVTRARVLRRAQDERGRSFDGLRMIGSDDSRGVSARFVLGRARELESRDLAVSRMIGNRLDLYYVQWRVPRRAGREYVPHPMGRFVMDRAIDKLLSMPHRLNVAPDPDLVGPDVLAGLADEPLVRDAPDERARRRALEELVAEEAQWRADRAEMALARLLGRAEEDAGLDLTEAVVWTGVVSGYAGPTRVAYDETAAPGESRFAVQALDRRFFHADGLGPHGPAEVLCSRRGRLRDLAAEGWRVDLPGRPEDPAALHGYWWTRRVPEGVVRPGSTGSGRAVSDSTGSGRAEMDGTGSGRAGSVDGREGAGWDGSGGVGIAWRKEVWHCVVVELGGALGARRSYGALAKRPTLMEGLTRIPYALRGVRPTVIRLPEFEAFEVNAFADVLWLLFDPMSRVLSWTAHLARLAADPNVTVKTPLGSAVDVDLTTPGAQNVVPVGTEVDVNLDAARASVLASQGSRLSDLAEKASFAGAALGQGIYQSSGLMTARLQEAGAESLISTRKACKGVVADTYRNLAMLARVYAPEEAKALSGRERIGVELPSVSREEAIRLLAEVRRVTEPDGRGVGLVSEDTGLELVGLAYPALEERKKQRQQRVWKTEGLPAPSASER